MVVPRFHPSGVGETLGDTFVTTHPIYVGASIFYVHSSGSDSFHGREKKHPKATLANAVSNAFAGDIIVLLDGHTETLTSAVAINKRLLIVGAGQSAGKPTVKFTPNSAGAHLFNISAGGVELRNIWFEENAQANVDAKILVSASLFRMVGCYVECNGNDDSHALYLTATSGVYEIRNTTFISTSTTAATAPYTAVRTVAATERMLLDGVTFDGGTVGWEGGNAYDEGAATTQLIGENVSLLRGSDMDIHADSIGYVIVPTSNGGSVVYWTGA